MGRIFSPDKSSSESTSISETTSVSTVTDARKGASDEAIIAEGPVDVDKSVTVISESADSEIIAGGLQGIENVATIGLISQSRTAVESIDAVENVAEASFDTSEEIFRQATGITGDALSDVSNVSRFAISEANEAIQLGGRQQASLATRFLEEGKNLITDRNREAGERIGSQLITAIVILGVGVSAFLILRRRK